jgi:hypothetical protein
MESRLQLPCHFRMLSKALCCTQLSSDTQYSFAACQKMQEEKLIGEAAVGRAAGTGKLSVARAVFPILLTEQHFITFYFLTHSSYREFINLNKIEMFMEMTLLGPRYTFTSLIYNTCRWTRKRPVQLTLDSRQQQSECRINDTVSQFITNDVIFMY